MPRKTFVAGEILTAADVNTNLMDQAVMVFDDATARTAAIPTASEGMVTYLKDTNLVTVFDGSVYKPVGGILQVVSTTKTDTFSTTTTGYVDVTGLSASITPTSATSKVLVFATVNWGTNNTADSHGLLKITGGNIASYVGDSAGSRTRAATGGRWSTTFNALTGGWTLESSMNHLDSPATTSPVTYQVQISRASGTVYVNRSHDDNDASHFGRFASTITVMEVAG